MKKLAQVDKQICVSCGACVKVCPKGAISIYRGCWAVVDADKCGGCGLCASLCPMGSIDASNPAEVSGICIKCCACVKGCPTGAKYYDDEGYLYHQHELEEMYQRRGEVEMFL